MSRPPTIPYDPRFYPEKERIGLVWEKAADKRGAHYEVFMSIDWPKQDPPTGRQQRNQ